MDGGGHSPSKRYVGDSCLQPQSPWSCWARVRNHLFGSCRGRHGGGSRRGPMETARPLRIRDYSVFATISLGERGSNLIATARNFSSDHQRGKSMSALSENSDLKSKGIDDLWQLHEQVVAKLARELSMKRARLEERSQARIGQQGYHLAPPAPSVPEGPSQIPEPEKSCRDLVRSRQATPLADGAASIGQEGERLSDPRPVALRARV